jgi:hypothetical protein
VCHGGLTWQLKDLVLKPGINNPWLRRKFFVLPDVFQGSYFNFLSFFTFFKPELDSDFAIELFISISQKFEEQNVCLVAICDHVYLRECLMDI